MRDGNARWAHLATIGQKHSPHRATVVQEQVAHCATTIVTKFPPHPATLLRAKPAFSRTLPHVAAKRSSQGSASLAAQRMEVSKYVVSDDSAKNPYCELVTHLLKDAASRKELNSR